MNSVDREFNTQSIMLKAYFFDKSKVLPFLKSVPKEESTFYFNDSYNYAYWKNPNFWNWDISKQCFEFDIPIRIIQGRQDFVNDGTQELFNLKSKNSKLYYIEKSGHFTWIEKPTKVFEIVKKALLEK